MKLLEKVMVAGYRGTLPVYLVDELTEQVGGKNPCPYYIGLAALDPAHKIKGEPGQIIVVSRQFLKLSKKNKLALLTYYNALPEQEVYDFHTNRGPELAAKMEVIAEHGKHRFKVAFRKVSAKERKMLTRSAGSVHKDFRKLQKKEVELTEKLDGFFDEDESDPVDIVEYFDEAVEISSYKGASILPTTDGVDRLVKDAVYEDEIDDDDEINLSQKEAVERYSGEKPNDELHAVPDDTPAEA